MGKSKKHTDPKDHKTSPNQKSPNKLSPDSPTNNLDAISYVSYEVDTEFDLHPLVAIIVTLIYILLGSLMYVQWEEEWGYHDAFYFIFISVSTIGFGDVTPSHPKFFLSSSFYILFGLALVAMVINVLMDFFKVTIEKVEDIIPDVLLEDSEAESEKKDVKSGLSQLAESIQSVHKVNS